jgi:sulfite exporter TauE/SafE/copper chaperone CopZ
MSDEEHLIRQVVRIGGMTCVNCEVFIERAVAQLPGVKSVRVNYRRGKAEITSSEPLDREVLGNILAEDGYTAVSWDEPGSPESFSRRDYLGVGAAFVALAGLYFGLRALEFLPQGISLPETISYGAAFLIGLVASVSSCMAVTGGLLVAMAARYNQAHQNLTPAQRFRPHLYFNVGRVVSYTLLGGMVGALGSTFSLSPGLNALLIILASAIMIFLGLQMVGIVPQFALRMPKSFLNKIHDLSERRTKGSAFALGTATFFLPCGFTQALQLYVLAQGNFEVGALTMLAFALGTLPALLSLSAVSSMATGAFQKHFIRLAGVAVVLLGLFNIQSGLTLAGVAGDIAPSSADGEASVRAPIRNGVQIVEMKIVDLQYEPHIFTVVQGIPVEWRIDASQARGCAQFIMAPALDIRAILSVTETNRLRFTPEQVGDIAFNCGMGMATPGSKFSVVPQKEAARFVPASNQAERSKL